jgi:hypothetical protein
MQRRVGVAPKDPAFDAIGVVDTRAIRSCASQAYSTFVRCG